jgi:S-DNA-T family DNA segregation ATPase FtsK/SpoIIIE
VYRKWYTFALVSLPSRYPYWLAIVGGSAYNWGMDMLNDIFAQYNVNADVVGVRRGPMVERHEIKLGRGVRVKNIINLRDDIVRIVGDENVNIVSPLDNGLVGIEIPRADRETVAWEPVDGSPLSIFLGKDIDGNPLVADLAKMPHLLVAGSTGSGKSVFINTAICSIVARNTPEQVQMVLVDPKQVELLPYQDLAHLAYPVATDADSARDALRFVVAEMDRRYRVLSEAGVRNIGEYHQGGGSMPYMVVVVDELADLMMVAKKEVESSIVRITQLARAAGIHLIVATQRPSVDVITGLIKANMPSRIAFTVASTTDSRVILDASGAEFLTGMGDGLFTPQGVAKPIRFQGAWIDESQVKEIVGKTEGMVQETTINNDLIQRANDIAIANHYVSASLLQSYLNINARTAHEVLKLIPSQEYVF